MKAALGTIPWFVSLLLLPPLSGQEEQKTGPVLPEGTKAHRDLAYVVDGHVRQKLDVFLPPNAKSAPLVVWVHGGAWLGGDKAQCPALRLLGEGFAVASVNYRLSRHAVFPAQIEDVKAAVRWLRANADRFGYDGNCIGAWGASAGGHLVALLGTSPGAPELEAGSKGAASTRVQAVCDFFGPTDLLQMGNQSGPNSRLDHDAADSPESRLVGGPIQERRELAQKANPIRYVSADDPPFLILHGDKDDLVPLGQSRLLHEALEKAGVRSTFHVVAGAGHGFGGRDIDAMVSEFFKRHLKGEKSVPTQPAQREKSSP